MREFITMLFAAGVFSMAVGQTSFTTNKVDVEVLSSGVLPKVIHEWPLESKSFCLSITSRLNKTVEAQTEVKIYKDNILLLETIKDKSPIFELTPGSSLIVSQFLFTEENTMINKDFESLFTVDGEYSIQVTTYVKGSRDIRLPTTHGDFVVVGEEATYHISMKEVTPKTSDSDPDKIEIDMTQFAKTEE